MKIHGVLVLYSMDPSLQEKVFPYLKIMSV